MLRLALAFLVMAEHLSKFIFIGHFAVYVFFILSGFWIFKMFEQKYQSQSLTTFYLSRALRIYPVYWLATLLMLPIYALTLGFNEQLTFSPIQAVFYLLTNLTLLGYTQTHPQLITPAWSLDIEMQFYFLFPFLFGILKMASVPILLFISVLIAFFLNHYPIFLSGTILAYLPYFLLGMWLAQPNNPFLKMKSAWAWILFFALLLPQYFIPFCYENTINDSNTYYNEALNFLLPLPLLPFLAKQLTQKSDEFDRDLGGLSYVLYLLHWDFLLIYGHFSAGLPMYSKIIFLGVYLMTTIIASAFIYMAFDKPLNQWRNKVLSTRMV